MKMKITLLIIWMFFTLVLTLTVIGMFLFTKDMYGNRSTWMEIGLKLLNNIIISDNKTNKEII